MEQSVYDVGRFRVILRDESNTSKGAAPAGFLSVKDLPVAQMPVEFLAIPCALVRRSKHPTPVRLRQEVFFTSADFASNETRVGWSNFGELAFHQICFGLSHRRALEIRHVEAGWRKPLRVHRVVCRLVSSTFDVEANMGSHLRSREQVAPPCQYPSCSVVGQNTNGR